MASFFSPRTAYESGSDGHVQSFSHLGHHRDPCMKSCLIFGTERAPRGFRLHFEPLNRARVSTSAASRANTSCALEMLQQLQSQMKQAIAREDYTNAASTRDTINMLLEKDPALQLRILIDKAVEEERYEDAWRYRNELENVGRESKAGPSCYSDTTTQGIRVQVRSVYVNDHSQPSKGQYLFAYRIRISNICARPVQVLSRHWVITDANGRMEQIRGVGAIGKQPVLLPGENFEYTSACPLGTATGKMEGDFEMKFVDEVTLLTFNVKVGSFDLAITSEEIIKGASVSAQSCPSFGIANQTVSIIPSLSVGDGRIMRVCGCM